MSVMYQLNGYWEDQKELGGIEDYIRQEYIECNANIFERCGKIVSVCSREPILKKIIKKPWSILEDDERKIYSLSLLSGKGEKEGMISKMYEEVGKLENGSIIARWAIQEYYPLICYAKIYYENENLEEENGEVVIYIKRSATRYNNMFQDGSDAGIFLDDDKCEIYLARTLDQIAEYAMLPDERDNMCIYKLD